MKVGRKALVGYIEYEAAKLARNRLAGEKSTKYAHPPEAKVGIGMRPHVQSPRHPLRWKGNK